MYLPMIKRILLLLLLAAFAPAQAAVFLPAGDAQQPDRYQVFGASVSAWVSADALWLSLPARNRPDAGVHLRLRFESAGGEPAKISPRNASGLTLHRYQGRDPQQWREHETAWQALLLTVPGLQPQVLVRVEEGRIVLAAAAADAARNPPLRLTLEVDGARLAATGDGMLQLAGPDGLLDLPLLADGIEVVLRGVDISGAARDLRVPELAPAIMGAEARGPSKQRSGDGDLAIGYATFLGAGLVDEAAATALTADTIFLAGHTQSIDFPTTPGAFRNAAAHVVNAYVAGLALDGSGGFVTVVQGTDQIDGEEFVFGLAAANDGVVHAAGNTKSLDFPVTSGAFQTEYGGNIDAVVFSLAADGTLLQSTYYGGSDYDSAQDLALGSDGTLSITGGTWSFDLPVSADAYEKNSAGERDVFVARFSADLSNLDYGSYAGGSSQDQGESLALSPSGAMYVTGWTRSVDFPLAAGNSSDGAARSNATSPFDAFLLHIDPSAVAPPFELMIGGTDEDRGAAVAVADNGDVLVGGRTGSLDFPVTPGSFGTVPAGGTCSFAPCPDVFLTRHSADGSIVHFAGLLAADDWDETTDLVMAADGTAWISGWTSSSDFPLSSNALDNTLDGNSDGFVAAVSADGSAVTYATLIGGDDEDQAEAIGVGVTGAVVVAGSTRSADFPVTGDAWDNTINGDYDAFAMRLDAAGAPADSDGDSIADTEDNCTLASNTDQLDSNGDGFGNLCDPDLNGDCATNFLDLGLMKAVFFSTDPEADLNGDGTVAFLDLGIMKDRFLTPPGPSALASCSN